MPRPKGEFVQEYLYEELQIPFHPPIEKKKSNQELERGFSVVMEAFSNDEKEDS